MIEGKVTADREAIVQLTVKGANLTQCTYDFVLDTGFTGYITLSQADISALELRMIAPGEFRFPGGEVRELTTYRALVLWDGEWKRVSVMPLTTDHLIGMHLLSGATITIQATLGGSVSVDLDTVEPFDENSTLA